VPIDRTGLDGHPSLARTSPRTGLVQDKPMQNAFAESLIGRLCATSA
jgi:hypothetical protein